MRGTSFLLCWLTIGGLLAGLLLTAPARAQAPQPELPAVREVALDSVQVAPQAVDISGWLLLDKDIQLELGGAVQNMYNFKFDKAEKQFRSLRRRYPQHPMAYFLLSLSTNWKMMPLSATDTRYDRVFLAYADTAEAKAEALYKADNHNYEACFFLAGAYGLEARLHAERHNWRKATVAARRSLNYLEKSKEANGLSADFLFGQGLFNYYAVWIGQEYPWLRPVLFFFPKGNREQGLSQIRQAAQGGLLHRHGSQLLSGHHFRQRPRAPDSPRPIRWRSSWPRKFPDNPYFQLNYAKLAFKQGNMVGK